MFGNKIKAYRFSILLSILCVVLAGVNYLSFRLKLLGAVFAICSIGCAIIIICYFIEKKRFTD